LIKTRLHHIALPCVVLECVFGWITTVSGGPGSTVEKEPVRVHVSFLHVGLKEFVALVGQIVANASLTDSMAINEPEFVHPTH